MGSPTSAKEILANSGLKNLEPSQKQWSCADCGEPQEGQQTQPRQRCLKCIQEARKLAKEARWKAVPQLLRAYGVPPGLSRWEASLEGMEWANKYADKSAGGLFLWGNSGVGKSVTCALIIRAWLNTWAASDSGEQAEHVRGEWRFINCASLVMELQDSWGDEKSALTVLKQYAQCPRLVIDDMGTEKPTDYVRQSMYYLINEREQWERQTIISSNFSLEQLNKQYDGRISSRIVGMCEVMKIDGADRRKK